MYRISLLLVLFTGTQAEFDPEKHANWDLLPHDVCGKAETNRVVGGSVPPMNSYPWLVRIGATLTMMEIPVFSCGGVLVNSDTVFTAAHCVRDIPDMFELGPIRLGEHNLDTDPDCEEGFCASSYIDVPPAEVLVPENVTDSHLDNDVALIRLKRKVKFSESILPICLGNKEFYKKDFAGKMAEVAGWGIRNVDKMEASRVLEVVKLQVQTDETCLKWYSKKGIPISSVHLCAGGKKGVDSCNGDSGGPLMIVDDWDDGPRYYLLGIVSIGPKICGTPELPGLYIKISSFIEWFVKNLDGATADTIKLL